MSTLSHSLLKSFVIGSSALIFAPFAMFVLLVNKKGINHKIYPIEAAIYFGTMNMLATFLRIKFGFSLWNSLVLVDALSIIMVSTLITARDIYHFKTLDRWLLQFLFIAVGHSLAYLLIIYNLEKIL